MSCKHRTNTYVSILSIGQSSVGLYTLFIWLKFLTPDFETWSNVNIHPELSTLNFLAFVFANTVAVFCAREGFAK